ncbi:hypothetical protein ACOMHN_058244 [Nucella lapillus]
MIDTSGPALLQQVVTMHMEVVRQDPVKLIEQTFALISQGLNLPSATQVYNDWMTSKAGQEEEVLPSLNSCRSMINRARREQLPQLTATVADIDLGPYAQTLGGESFILHHDDQMLVLSTVENLRVLHDSKIAFMDGTFKAAPRPLFTQLFGIHAVSNGHFVTLVYCLMRDKSRHSYHQLFEVVKRKMAEVDLVFSPDEIMSDFESGLIPAVRHNFPNTRHKGCYFHHSQAIWRRVQQLGLQAVYQEDDRVKTFIRKLMAIAFLPVIAVRPALTTLGDEPYLVDVPQLQLLLLYYADTWLNGSFPQSM